MKINNINFGSEEYIVEIYKLFYNKIPNFKDKAISLEIQCMMYILSEYGISLHDSSDYIMYKKSIIPFSYDVKQIIDSLKNNDDLNCNEKLTILPSNTIEVIKNIGIEIDTALSFYESREEGLIDITKSLYISKYIKPNERKINKIKKISLHKNKF